MLSTRNATLFVDLNALFHNVVSASSALDGAGVIPVLKADAYGLGMISVAKALESLPQVVCFAVAQVYEGVLLRESGVKKAILVLEQALPEQLETALAADLDLTVGRVSDLKQYAKAAEKRGVSARIQIKSDTGLHRIGVEKKNFYALCRALSAYSSNLTLCGVYSHFADPDDVVFSARQYALFLDFCSRLKAAGFSIPLRHISDSAASERYPGFALDAVRLGRRLAWDAPTGQSFGIREAASLRAAVLDVRRRKKGECLGYGGGIVLERDSDIAILGIGYGDGLDPRMAQHRLSVLLHDTPCPLLYSFMDQSLVDVTGVPVRPGEYATLFGYSETGAFLSGQKQALACGANEACALTTALLPRVERIYLS